jgi:hypothetical protein
MSSCARVFCVAIMLLARWEPSLAQEGTEPDKRIGILLAAGDITACYHKNRKYKEVAELIQREVDKAAGLPVAVLVLGDVAYSNRNKKGKLIAPFYADCFKEFKTLWGTAHYERLLPVAGNHDYSDDPTNSVYQGYFQERFTALNADKDTQFYATTFPQGNADGWLLAAVNFYRDRKSQEGLLRTALTNSKAKCVLVFSHPFLMSSGEHGRKEPSWTYTKMEPFKKIAVEQGATLLVTAHDHDYERFARQDAAGNEVAGGLGSFVVGTGGAHLYGVPDDKRHSLSRAFQNTAAGLLKLELYPDRYTSSFVTIDGTVLDPQTEPQDCSKRPGL